MSDGPQPITTPAEFERLIFPGFYVYVWRDPQRAGTPFYVGKGQGKRMDKREARSLFFRRYLEGMRCRDVAPEIDVMHCATEAEAFELERFLIAATWALGRS